MRRTLWVIAVVAAFAVTILLAAGLVAADAPAQQDAYQAVGGWPGYSESDSVCYVGRVGSAATHCGWRFTGLNIPAGATISDARLNVAQSGWGYLITTTFRFEDAASPAALAEGFHARPQTVTGITWQWAKAGPGDIIQSPNLAVALQELVDRYGAIDTVVLIESPDPATPNGNNHSWTTIDGGTVPTLTVSFDGGGTLPAEPTSTPEPTATPTEPPADGPAVLWVGNSYTSYNGGVHSAFQQLSGGNYATHHIGGSNLGAHVGPELSGLIAQGWDYVVLQGLVGMTETPEDFRAALDQLVPEIEAAGAQPVIFAPWTWQRGAAQPISGTQCLSNNSLAQIAADYGAIFVPVGVVWEQHIAGVGPTELYDPDGTHPVQAGTDLAAQAFFSLIGGCG